MPSTLSPHTVTVMTDQIYRDRCDKHLDQYIAGLLTPDELESLLIVARQERDAFYR